MGFNINDDQLRAILKIYGNDQGEIKYLEFLTASVNAQPGDNTMTPPTYIPKDKYYIGETALDRLLVKIKNIVKKDRIRLQEFFIDHDLLRKGYLPVNKFQGVLNSQKIELTRNEYDLLEGAFKARADPTKIDYVAFNAEVDKVFTEKDLEVNPTKRLGDYKVPSIFDAKTQLAAPEEQELDQIMQAIGTEVRNRRLMVKPFFQDKDKSKSGFVANTRFRSIFDNLKIQISDREYGLICRRFQAKADNEINYVEFDHVLKRYSGDDKPF